MIAAIDFDDEPRACMVDWGIEARSDFQDTDTVVYSALAVFATGEVRPLLLIREVGTYEWWGDTCEYVDGAWRELGRADDWNAETYVAAPLENDPSFLDELYSHGKQRNAFARWRERLRGAQNGSWTEGLS